jgi:pyridoxal phosphate enzyme (YggS family)
MCITNHLEDLQVRIANAAQTAGRDVNDITILAVTKRQNVAAVHEAADAGLTAMGENYVQEALEKIAQTDRNDVEWHFIGKIQANKTRAIAENFDWVHTVTTPRIARRLSDRRPAQLAPLNVCVQVCTDPELMHDGCSYANTLPLCETISELQGLKLRGLMTMPNPFTEIEQQRLPYRQLRELYEQLNDQGMGLDTLSMGMSADLEAAIYEGSTMLRVGTALFGPRPDN